MSCSKPAVRDQSSIISHGRENSRDVSRDNFAPMKCNLVIFCTDDVLKCLKPKLNGHKEKFNLGEPQGYVYSGSVGNTSHVIMTRKVTCSTEVMCQCPELYKALLVSFQPKAVFMLSTLSYKARGSLISIIENAVIGDSEKSIFRCNSYFVKVFSDVAQDMVSEQKLTSQAQACNLINNVYESAVIANNDDVADTDICPGLFQMCEEYGVPFLVLKARMEGTVELTNLVEHVLQDESVIHGLRPSKPHEKALINCPIQESEVHEEHRKVAYTDSDIFHPDSLKFILKNIVAAIQEYASGPGNPTLESNRKMAEYHSHGAGTSTSSSNEEKATGLKTFSQGCLNEDVLVQSQSERPVKSSADCCIQEALQPASQHIFLTDSPSALNGMTSENLSAMDKEAMETQMLNSRLHNDDCDEGPRLGIHYQECELMSVRSYSPVPNMKTKGAQEGGPLSPVPQARSNKNCGNDETKSIEKDKDLDVQLNKESSFETKRTFLTIRRTREEQVSKQTKQATVISAECGGTAQLQPVSQDENGSSSSEESVTELNSISSSSPPKINTKKKTEIMAFPRVQDLKPAREGSSHCLQNGQLQSIVLDEYNAPSASREETTLIDVNLPVPQEFQPSLKPVTNVEENSVRPPPTEMTDDQRRLSTFRRQRSRTLSANGYRTLAKPRSRTSSQPGENVNNIRCSSQEKVKEIEQPLSHKNKHLGKQQLTLPKIPIGNQITKDPQADKK